MKKSDLKTGMLLIFNNNQRSIVVLETERGDLFVSNGIGAHADSIEKTWGTLDCLNEDLEYVSPFDTDFTDQKDKPLFVRKVFSIPHSNRAFLSFDLSERKLLWDKEETAE